MKYWIPRSKMLLVLLGLLAASDLLIPGGVWGVVWACITLVVGYGGWLVGRRVKP